MEHTPIPENRELPPPARRDEMVAELCGIDFKEYRMDSYLLSVHIHPRDTDECGGLVCTTGKGCQQKMLNLVEPMLDAIEKLPEHGDHEHISNN